MGMDSPLTVTTTSQPRLLLDLDWSFPLHIECESQYFGLCTRINLSSKPSVAIISYSFISKSWFSSIFSNLFPDLIPYFFFHYCPIFLSLSFTPWSFALLSSSVPFRSSHIHHSLWFSLPTFFTQVLSFSISCSILPSQVLNFRTKRSGKALWAFAIIIS